MPSHPMEFPTQLSQGIRFAPPLDILLGGRAPKLRKLCTKQHFSGEWCRLSHGMNAYVCQLYPGFSVYGCH